MSSVVSSSGSTSTHLLARVRAHDEAAWRQLAELYGPMVYDWCRQARLQPADAADIVQEVFRGVLTGISSFDHRRDGATFRGWLRSITRHKLIDQARRQGKQPAAPGGTTNQQLVGQLSEEEPEPGSGQHPAGGRVSHMQDALLSLRVEIEDRTWQAFWRTAVEDRPAADVAAELQMTVTAVYQAKSRILARLRQLLAR
ncbi:MAG: RNA polymerase sigma factor [Pirellulales bacterium]